MNECRSWCCRRKLYCRMKECRSWCCKRVCVADIQAWGGKALGEWDRQSILG
jgi:hypothetical protein